MGKLSASNHAVPPPAGSDDAALADMLLAAGFTRAERAAAPEIADRDVAAVLATTGPGDPVDRFNAVIAAGRAGANGFWRDRCVATGQRLARDLWGGPRPPAAPRRFTVAIERRFVPGHRRRLRLPLPIADAALADLRVATDATVARDRIETVADESAAVTLAATYSFEARPVPPADPPDDAWLAPREGPIRAIRSMKAEPAGTLRQRADRLYHHLLDRVRIGQTRWDAAEPPDARDWLDCRLAAALFVGRCRGISISARLVSGYLLWDAPMEHYWAEAWVGDHWASYDFLAWDLSAAGTLPEWRDIFAGRVDHRMKTQCFPAHFTGAPGADLAAGWHRFYRLVPGGTETRYVSPKTGALLYAETVRVMPA